MFILYSLCTCHFHRGCVVNLLFDYTVFCKGCMIRNPRPFRRSAESPRDLRTCFKLKAQNKCP